MFTECPYCGFLVALDDQGQPLPRCPNCAQRLREAPADSAGDAAKDGSGDAAAVDPTCEAQTPQHAETGDAQRSDDADDEGDSGPRADGAASGTPVPVVLAEAAADLKRESTDAAAPRDATPPSDATDAPQPSPSGMQDATPPALAAQPPTPIAAEAIGPETASLATPDAAAPTMQATPASEPQPAPSTAPGADASTAAPDAPDAHAAPGEPAAAIADSQEDTQADPPSEAPEASGTLAAETMAASEPPSPASDAAGIAASPSPARTPRSAPSFARAARRAPATSRRRRWLERGAVAGLLLLLGTQLLVADRARLATDARWRPLLSTLCNALRCTLPPWREPSAFRVVERDVRAHAPGVLRVSARIRNDARWAQPWPALQLTLSDAHGRAMATRIFQPREYFGGAPAQQGLDSGQEAALSMDIVEPGPQAVAFTFEFR